MTKMTIDQKLAVIAAASTFVSKIYESSEGNCFCNLCLFSKDAIFKWNERVTSDGTEIKTLELVYIPHE